MKKNFDIKYAVIIALCVAVVSMGIAFAALSQNLTITGVAGIGDASWGLEITNIVEGEMTGASTNGLGKSATSATFDVDLDYPGAKATYKLTVKNKGTIDAELASITGVDAANDAAPDILQFAVTGISVGDKLAKDESTIVTVTVEWIVPADGSSIPQLDTSKTATITLNYVQDTD